MNPEEIQIPIQKPDPTGSHILLNQDMHLGNLNKTAEHHLVKTDSIDQTLEHSLIVQDRTLEAVKGLSDKLDPQEISDGGTFIVKGIKGDKGDAGEKGDKGDSPTSTEIESLIKPLIPEPVKGDKGDKGDAASIPTKKEIADLLKPFIPGPIPGKDGLDGNKGEKGDRGKDGSPDTAEQIISKIKGKFHYSDIDGAIDDDHIADIARRFHVASKDYAFTELTDAPKSYKGMSGLVVTVNPSETGLIFTPQTGGGGGDEQQVFNEYPSDPINSSNKVYTTLNEFTVGTTRVYYNGARQALGIDYTETSNTQISFTTAPDTGSVLFFDYQLLVVTPTVDAILLQDGSNLLLQDGTFLQLQV